jgi:hypothetical protein
MTARDLLKRIYNACDPLEPATEEQYIDSDEARGSFDLSNKFCDRLSMIKKDEKFLCFLFSGHVGCGKSSELRHLARELRSSDPPYFPIIVDANDYLDAYDVTTTDILLMIVSGVARELKNDKIPLNDNYFYKRFKEVASVLFSDVKVDSGDVKLGAVTANFSLLKNDPHHRLLVRKALMNDQATLQGEIAHIFENARMEIRKKKSSGNGNYSDFIVIVDNLEKLQRVQKNNGEFFEDGSASHRELFIERSNQLSNLGAHMIYTVPLPLMIESGTELQSNYGGTPYILPMIKVEDRRHASYASGYETLRKLLGKRLGENVELDSAIDPDALDFLIRYTGGNTREFITRVQSAAVISSDKAPIDLQSAQHSISESVPLYSSMPQAYFPKLAQLELSDNQSIDIGDSDVQKMLHELRILEYRNGDTATDPFNPAAPWYAVHPIIRELNLFKNAVEAEKSNPAPSPEQAEK